MSHHLRSFWGHRPTQALPAVIAAITLLGCGGEPPTGAPAGPPVALSVSISPSALDLIVGSDGRFNALALDFRGLSVPASFEWSSADPSIATVRASDGTVSAIAIGTTTVTATTGTLSATATISVRPPNPPAAVFILPSSLTLVAGDVERLYAYAQDAAGRTTTASFEWSSADLTVATVGKTDGIVTAVSVGATIVTARVGTVLATATATVVTTAGTLAGPFAFTRMTSSDAGTFISDVISISGADRTLRSLPRPTQFASIAAPAWSTDGTRLAVEVIHTFVDSPEWLDYKSDLYVLDAAAQAASPWRALTTNGLSKSPSWSPDGKRIAYLHQDALFSYNHIYIIDAAGGAPGRLTLPEGYHSTPRWSPDGTRLAFSVYEDGGNHSAICIVNADGSGLTTVTRSFTSEYDPSWSPDGMRLAFVRFRNSPVGTYQYDVLVADADGSNVNLLTSLGNSVGGPVWSPDGRQIMFSSGRALYAINADGSGLFRPTTPPPNSWDGAPAWIR